MDDARFSTAMQSRGHMLEWAAATGRQWLVFWAEDFINGLWDIPDVDPTTKELLSAVWFRMLINKYIERRAVQDSGETEEVMLDGERVTRPIKKWELPTKQEWQDLADWVKRNIEDQRP